MSVEMTRKSQVGLCLQSELLEVDIGHQPAYGRSKCLGIKRGV